MSTHRFRFSIRNLLVLTTVVAVFLMLAVRVPGLPALIVYLSVCVIFVVIFVDAPFGLFKFMTANRRPKLAMVTWAFLGSLFVVAAVVLSWAAAFEYLEDIVVPLLLACSSLVIAAMCYRSASRLRRRGPLPKMNLP